MNHEVVVLREVVTKVTRMLAGKKGLRVTQEGANAFVQTDARTLEPIRVNIPNIPDNASEDFILAIQGFIDHEVGHVLDTDWTVVRESNLKGPTWNSWRNIFEDPRVEKCQQKRFPGATHNLNRLHTFFLEKITKPALAMCKTPADEFGVLGVPMVRAWAGQKVFQDFMNDYWDHPLVKAVMDRMPQEALDRVPHMKSTQDAWELAQILHAIIYPPAPPAPPPPQEQDEKNDQQQGQGDSDEKSDEKQDGKGSNQNKPEDDEDQGSGGDKSDEKDEGDDAEDGDDRRDEGKDGDAGDEPESGDEGDADADAADEPGAEGGVDEDEAEADGAEGDSEDQGDGAADEQSDEKGRSGSQGEDDDSDEPAEGKSGSQGDDREDEAGEESDEGSSGDDADGGESGADGDDGDDQDDAGEGEQSDSGDQAGSDGSDDDEGDQAGEDAGDDEEGDVGDDRDGDLEQGSGSDGEGEENEDDRQGQGEEDEEEGGDRHMDATSSPFAHEHIEPSEFDNAIANRITDEASRNARGADYIVYSKDYDRIEPLELPKEVPDAWTEFVEDKTRMMVGPMQKEIERMMAARSLVQRVPGYRSGRLHAANLHRLMVNDDRIYRRNHVNNSKDTVVYLKIDNSGSMQGTKMTTAMLAGYALSQTLERVGIKHQVSGFTTIGLRMGNHRGHFNKRGWPLADWAEVQKEQSRLGREFSRVEGIYMPIYKGFDERVTPEVRKRFAVAAQNQVPMGANVDGESVEFALREILKRKEARKVILVLSDGMPATGPGNAREVYSHLHKVVDDAKKANVEMIGIGIQSDAVRTFYPKNMVLNNVEELPSIVMGELKRILTAA